MKQMIQFEQANRPGRVQLFFSSLRAQAALCLLFGVAIPVLIYFRGDVPFILWNTSAINSTLLAAIATLSGVVAVRKFGIFPGTIVASYIFPVFVACYGIAVAAILLARAPYSGALLTLTFLAATAVRFAISALERRHDAGRYYLVPGGDIDRLLPDVGLASTTLHAPMLPEGADAVIVADLHYDHTPEWERIFATAALRGLGVYHYKQVWEAQTGKVRIEHLSENSLGSLLPSNSYAKAKRLIDILFSFAVIPILIIPLAVAAAAIRFDSPGPIFFRQDRIGYRGKAFSVLKFRTMRVAEPAAEGADQLHAAITQDDDMRVTKVGRFFRQTRIDELPQVFNILRGEMSWIGPRPEAQPLSEWYEREIPFYLYRHIVRPGITGWAQVNQGHVAGISEVHDKLRFDFYYIKNFSMWLDLVILFKTAVVVVRGSGAK